MKTSCELHTPFGETTNSWRVAGEEFELDRRYRVMDYLGSGAYGVVCSAEDERDGMVAIKKCKKIFQSRTLAKRTLREIRLLRNLRHENIIQIKTILRPADPNSFGEIYIVFELMETDLAQIIRSSQPLRDQHVQYFIYQLLKALEYIHSANILHRDLKPRNLLVNADCRLKVADFGLARLYTEKSSNKIVAMTEYVTTRWYRAPEILVGWAKYTAAVDLWAVGCIMAELIGRTPIFPGQDSMRQVEMITRFTGKPNTSFIDQSKKPTFKQLLEELPDSLNPVNIKQLYPQTHPLGIDMLSRLLRLNPSDRMTASEALSHPFLQFISAKRETVEEIDSSITEEFAFEEVKLSMEDLRLELLHEVECFNAPSGSSTQDLLALLPTPTPMPITPNLTPYAPNERRSKPIVLETDQGEIACYDGALMKKILCGVAGAAASDENSIHDNSHLPMHSYSDANIIGSEETKDERLQKLLDAQNHYDGSQLTKRVRGGKMKCSIRGGGGPLNGKELPSLTRSSSVRRLQGASDGFLTTHHRHITDFGAELDRGQPQYHRGGHQQWHSQGSVPPPFPAVAYSTHPVPSGEREIGGSLQQHQQYQQQQRYFGSSDQSDLHKRKGSSTGCTTS